MVHDAAGRTDHDVRAVLQRGGLVAQRHTAAQHHHLDVFFRPRQTADFSGHLVGQLARGAQHHGLHRKTPRIQVGQQRNAEGCRFAAAGFGLGNQVFAEQRNRQARRLNRRHLGVAEPGQVGQHVGRQG